MDKLNANLIRGMSEKSFKSVNIIDENGEKKTLKAGEFKTWIEKKAFGGITTTQLEKILENAGIKLNQMAERKRIVKLFEDLLNPTIEADTKKKIEIEEELMEALYVAQQEEQN